MAPEQTGRMNGSIRFAERSLRPGIDLFELGEHDTPDRLIVPEKLYGRAREIDTLCASFDLTMLARFSRSTY
jgi:hypothetical protein